MNFTQEEWEAHWSKVPDALIQKQLLRIREKYKDEPKALAAYKACFDVAADKMGPDALWSEDFIAKVGPTKPMLVSSFLPANSTLLVSGAQKLGKSFFLLQMADDIARGRPLFGEWNVDTPGPVLYLDCEMGEATFRARMVTRGMEDLRKSVAVHSQRGCTLARLGGMDWLKRQYDLMQPVAMIIDTVRTALTIRDWNNPAEVTDKMSAFGDVVQTFTNGCSLIFAAHNNKSEIAEGGNKISGTNALPSNVDAYIVLDKKRRDSATKELIFEATGEGRWEIPTGYTVYMNPDTLHMRIRTEEAKAAAAAAGQAKGSETRTRETSKKCLDAIRNANAELTDKQISEIISMDVRTVSLHMEALHDEAAAAPGAERKMARNKTARTWKLGPNADSYLFVDGDDTTTDSAPGAGLYGTTK